MLSDNSFHTIGHIIRTFKLTLELFIILTVSSFQLLFNVPGQFFNIHAIIGTVHNADSDLIPNAS